MSDDTAADTADLAVLLDRLNAFCADGADTADGRPDVVARVPAPDEAMAIYTVAVRLVQSRLVSEGIPAEAVETSRDVLIGTRRVLRAALDRVEGELARPRLVLIDCEG